MKVKVKYWVKFPSSCISSLKDLQYKNDKLGSANGKIAALMIYIAMLIEVSKEENYDNLKISYTTIEIYTGISRSLIRKGLDILENLKILHIDKSKKYNLYKLIDVYEFEKKWFKFPASPLLNKEQNKITCFKNFSLRNRSELHALKILLCIGSVRNNLELYSFVSYDKLASTLSISRSDISKGLSFLYVNELLVKASPTEEHLLENDVKYNLPKRYYLKGYVNFTKK